MKNTLLIGDFLLVDKVGFSPSVKVPLLPYQDIQRNNIVIFHYPVDPHQHFVKRVIGVPGDRVRLINGKVFVNGVLSTEPYTIFVKPTFEGYRMYRDNFPSGRPYDPQVTPEWAADMAKLVRNGELVVPQGHYFVMGDNRNDSLDSRYWGLVKRESIIGRPLLVYLSLRGWSGGTGGAMAHAGGDDDDDDKIPPDDSWWVRAVHGVRWSRSLHVVP